MPSDRPMLTVRISEEARAAFDDFCRSHGITLTALIEAVGLRFREADEDPAAAQSLLFEVERTVKIARDIDAKRRTRRS